MKKSGGYPGRERRGNTKTLKREFLVNPRVGFLTLGGHQAIAQEGEGSRGWRQISDSCEYDELTSGTSVRETAQLYLREQGLHRPWEVGRNFQGGYTLLADAEVLEILHLHEEQIFVYMY